MWVLKSSPASPFGRKVKIAAAVCGLSGRIDVEATDTTDPTDAIRDQNPLGKIPALILEDGTVVYDSRVILEYLDSEAGGGIVIPYAGRERIEALTLQALADGIMDAALMLVYERRWRPEHLVHPPWTEHQAGKIDRALTATAAAIPRLSGVPHVGQIALACALGYLDLRLEGRWRTAHPDLAEWLEDFAAAVPSFAATAPPP